MAGSHHTGRRSWRPSTVRGRNLSSMLDGRRQAEADLRRVLYVRPYGYGFHVVKNLCNDEEYVVADGLGFKRTFAPGTVVMLGSQTGHPGEMLISGPPSGMGGASAFPVSAAVRSGYGPTPPPPAPDPINWGGLGYIGLSGALLDGVSTPTTYTVTPMAFDLSGVYVGVGDPVVVDAIDVIGVRSIHNEGSQQTLIHGTDPVLAWTSFYDYKVRLWDISSGLVTTVDAQTLTTEPFCNLRNGFSLGGYYYWMEIVRSGGTYPVGAYPYDQVLSICRCNASGSAETLVSWSDTFTTGDGHVNHRWFADHCLVKYNDPSTGAIKYRKLLFSGTESEVSVTVGSSTLSWENFIPLDNTTAWAQNANTGSDNQIYKHTISGSTYSVTDLTGVVSDAAAGLTALSCNAARTEICQYDNDPGGTPGQGSVFLVSRSAIADPFDLISGSDGAGTVATIIHLVNFAGSY